MIRFVGDLLPKDDDPPADGLPQDRDMTLPWKHVDLDRAEMCFVNGKTGDRTVHLSPAAVGVLTALPREADNP